MGSSEPKAIDNYCSLVPESATAMNKKMPQEIPNVSVVSPAHCVGPDYRPDEQKPTATVSTVVSYDTVHTLPQTPQLIALLTYVS